METSSKNKGIKDSNYFNRLINDIEDVEVLRELFDLKLKDQIPDDDPYIVTLFFLQMVKLSIQESSNHLGTVSSDFSKELASNLSETEGFLRQYAESISSEIDKLNGVIQGSQEAAIKISESKVNSSVNTLIKQASFTKAIHDFTTMARLGLYLLVFGAFSAVGGYSLGYAAEFRYGNGTGLSDSDTATLQWANSDLGKFFRKFEGWNREGLYPASDGRLLCESDTKDQGITLRKNGKSASRGFCVFWTIPPGDRVFTN